MKLKRKNPDSFKKELSIHFKIRLHFILISRQNFGENLFGILKNTTKIFYITITFK